MPLDVERPPAAAPTATRRCPHLRGPPEHEGSESDIRRNVVFGGQILAQMIMAAHLDRNEDRTDDKEVKSIHAIFARAGDYTQPINYEVERMHDGRTLGSDTVTFSQQGRIMSRGPILWSKDEPDLIRHTENVAMPAVPRPTVSRSSSDGRVFPGAAGLIVDGINTWSDDEPLRPAVQHVWTRYEPRPSPVADQAILSWATDGYLIGTAMLPHEGHNEGHAHKTISTGVVSPHPQLPRPLPRRRVAAAGPRERVGGTGPHPRALHGVDRGRPAGGDLHPGQPGAGLRRRQGPHRRLPAHHVSPRGRRPRAPGRLGPARSPDPERDREQGGGGDGRRGADVVPPGPLVEVARPAPSRRPSGCRRRPGRRCGGRGTRR